MRPPSGALSPALRRPAADLRAAEVRLARAIAALARAERRSGRSPRGAVQSLARRRLRAAEADETRAGAAVAATIARIADTPAAGPADLAFKLALLARLLGVDASPVPGEPVDRRLLRSLLRDAAAAQR